MIKIDTPGVTRTRDLLLRRQAALRKVCEYADVDRGHTAQLPVVGDEFLSVRSSKAMQCAKFRIDPSRSEIQIHDGQVGNVAEQCFVGLSNLRAPKAQRLDHDFQLRNDVRHCFELTIDHRAQNG
jgi:hypothetical protein